MTSSVKVGVVDNNLTRGGHILRKQEYHTRHGISAIPDKIHREIWREPCQPEVPQEPVVYLLLEDPLGWNGPVPSLPVPASSQSSQSAHSGRAEADPGYSPT